MKKDVKKTHLEQLEEGLQSVKDWQAGKVKLRTWEVDTSGNRRMFYQSYGEYRDEKDAGKRLRNSQDVRRRLMVGAA